MAAEPFERVPRLRRGYDRGQVEKFFARARRVWDAGGPPGQVTSWHVRTVGFDLRPGGYDIAAVDVALDRIEDASASREQRGGSTNGSERDAVATRLERPAGQRFPRARMMNVGYRRGDVDVLLEQIRDDLTGGQQLSVAEVRGAVFRGVRGRRSYAEAPVDACLDRVVDLLRRRHLPSTATEVHGFRPLPNRGPAVSRALTDRLRDADPE